ncbi:MAG TPA: hypothetical protein VJZ76_25150 [Thermoanaerobaculia bacterium]|nr:hypothetical protein [Thermoanaerobaculia bacterium]
MKPALLLSLLLAVPLAADTITLQPSTPKAGDSVVVTVHGIGGGNCPPTTRTAKLVGHTLTIEETVTGPCIACPAVALPFAFSVDPVTFADAQPYTIDYVYTDCMGKSSKVATKSVLVTPSCAFDRSLAFATQQQPPVSGFNLLWCDPSYSPFPDFGQSAIAYRVFLVRDGDAPILVHEAAASQGTQALIKLAGNEAGVKGVFAEAVMCNITIAGCRDTFVLKSNVLPVNAAPLDACSGGGAALCLDNRFSVTARYHTATGSSPANPVPMTKESGYFWFFGPDNAEVVVKIVDACSFTNNFWFFASGMTDVGVDLVVRDTKTGAVSRYSSPAGTAFAPIQDTNAFASCH